MSSDVALCVSHFSHQSIIARADPYAICVSLCPSQQFTKRDRVCSYNQFSLSHCLSLCVYISLSLLLWLISLQLVLFPPRDPLANFVRSPCPHHLGRISHHFLNLFSCSSSYFVHFVPPSPQVAILVPFRNRHEHLPILLRHLVPVLQKQRLEFAFYLIEQVWALTHLLPQTDPDCVSLPVYVCSLSNIRLK